MIIKLFELFMASLLRVSHCWMLQLLVDWTGGKNLIISSGGSSVNEIRGPYDVANLLSLLGISMERGKASISKSCRYE